MERYYTAGLASAAPGDRLELDGPEAHHLTRVKRARPGARVLLFDGAGSERWAEVEDVDRRSAAVRVLADPTPGRAPAVRVTLAVAPPKGKRMAWLLEKATELGVSRLVPLLCTRGVVDPTAREAGRREKWRRATIEAAKQCGLLTLPELAEPADLAAALAQPASVRLLLDPADDATSLDEVLGADFGEGVLALVGPEGGFTDEERALCRAQGAVPVRLAPTVLRVETAAIAVLAAIRSLHG